MGEDVQQLHSGYSPECLVGQVLQGTDGYLSPARRLLGHCISARDGIGQLTTVRRGPRSEFALIFHRV